MRKQGLTPVYTVDRLPTNGMNVNAALAESLDIQVSLHGTASWWDRDAECTLVVARPPDEPELWDEYLDGAARSYRKHGVEDALDMSALRTGGDTALFFAALDAGGRVLGGLRAKGPLRDAEDSHAVIEWDGQPGLAAVRKMINDRAPFGILEFKSAWVDAKPNGRAVTRAMARTAFHAMAVMDIQFCMATSAEHVLNSWATSGGVVAANIPPTPYPDERYQTRMMWWDRTNFTKYAEPDQLSKILQETRALRNELSDHSEADVLYRIGG